MPVSNRVNGVPAIVAPAEDLATLAREINAEHEAGEGAARRGLEHFRAAGERLLKAKHQVGHGGWLRWLETNITFSRQQAASYMRVAARWEECKAALHLRAALRLLSEYVLEEDEPEPAPTTVPIDLGPPPPETPQDFSVNVVTPPSESEAEAEAEPESETPRPRYARVTGPSPFGTFDVRQFTAKLHEMLNRIAAIKERFPDLADMLAAARESTQAQANRRQCLATIIEVADVFGELADEARSILYAQGDE
jgi:hypothetical protein